MKLNLKMIAVAAAMAASGVAHADLVGTGTGNGSLALYAFNTSTLSFYVRNLGFQLNSFLPSTVTTLPGDGGVTGTMTPEAGLTLNKTNTASFADAAFGTWLAQQGTSLAQQKSNVKWSLVGGDSLTAGLNGVDRLLLAGSTDFTATNATVRNAVNPQTGSGGMQTLVGPFGLSATGTFNAGNLSLSNGILNDVTLSSLDVASSLFYFSATTQTGSSSVLANTTKYGNSAGYAKVLLASNGDFSYTLAAAAPPAAVPVPAAMWLMGSGLVGIGGMIRRRKAAAQA